MFHVKHDAGRAGPRTSIRTGTRFGAFLHQTQGSSTAIGAGPPTGLTQLISPSSTVGGQPQAGDLDGGGAQPVHPTRRRIPGTPEPRTLVRTDYVQRTDGGDEQHAD
ncbi:hypothetical protein ACIBAH_06490 [Streptomyces sp. NPDC051445]|uniref:hypothetical protein n=1 Tax=Streptomyces sp. NPDC051445 TaxID=3365653 RepID=UPI003797DA30